ncbi:hypothetical protein J057_24635 [Marinobacter nanhaiticus D15-8W]|uniref:Uncharacterized protein n=1 Tax=Marinobacter nanhaiticus D15-8W TaxID=626887 RepID=A0A371CG94_9GAMM|nr:hypothetical protein J057_24635 [Marinobacter nanhaiticus D15-8W]
MIVIAVWTTAPFFNVAGRYEQVNLEIENGVEKRCREKARRGREAGSTIRYVGDSGALWTRHYLLVAKLRA